MRIKRAKIATVDEIYFLVDKCGKVVMPVYRYMLLNFPTHANGVIV